MPFSQTFAPVQKEDLAPQVIQAVWGRGPGQFHHTVDTAAHTCQGLEPLGAVALKTAALIHHDHVKGPCVPVVVHQPADILPVDDVQVCRRVQGPDPLGLAPQHRRYPQHLCVVPFSRFPCPGPFCHLLRCNHQHPAHQEPVILKLLYGGQGCDRLAESHIQKKPQLLDLNDLIDAVLLVSVWFKFHCFPLSAIFGSQTDIFWHRLLSAEIILPLPTLACPHIFRTGILF